MRTPLTVLAALTALLATACLSPPPPSSDRDRAEIEKTEPDLADASDDSDEPDEEPEEESDEEPEESAPDLAPDVEQAVIADCEEWQEQDESLNTPEFTPYCWADRNADNTSFEEHDNTGYVLITITEWGHPGLYARTVLDLSCGEIDEFAGVEVVVDNGAQRDDWDCDDDRPPI